MHAERQPGSLVVRDQPNLLRVTLLAFGATIALAVATQWAGEPARLALGGLGAAFCFVCSGLLESVSFEFDESRRVLRWSRRSLFRCRAGEVPFHEIRSVHVRVREDRERDGSHVRVDRSWRVELDTEAGALLLSSRTFPDEAGQTAIADAIRESLGLVAESRTARAEVEELVAGGELVAAIRLARETRGLSLEAAKQLVDELREKSSH